MKRGFICAKSSSSAKISFYKNQVNISADDIKCRIENLQQCMINIIKIIYYDNIEEVKVNADISDYGFLSFDKDSDISVFVNETDFEFKTILFISKSANITDETIQVLLEKIHKKLSNHIFSIPVDIYPINNISSNIIDFYKNKSNLICKVIKLDFMDPASIVDNSCDLFFNEHKDLLQCSAIIDFNSKLLYINTNKKFGDEIIINKIDKFYQLSL